MAWIPNQLPQNWFPGMVNSDTEINIPLTAFPEITASEIDATTGDIRKMLYGFIERCWVKWNSILLADRCAKMTITKTSSVDTTTGLITSIYTFTFKNNITAQDVADEV